MADSELIGVEISGIDSLLAILVEIESPAVQQRVMTAVGKLIKGKLQKYPPQVSVTRQRAYGQTFFTDKQRRYFFAALRAGIIEVPRIRTNDLSNNWTVMAFNPAEVLVVNPTPYGPWVQGPPGGGKSQSRMHKLIGWKTVDVIVDESEAQAAKIAEEEYNRVLKKGGR